MPVRGVDVSNHQREIDWRKVAADGISFAWCKATEGTQFTDAWWGRNRREAAKHGVRVGAYHFGRPGNKPEDDARHFLSIAHPEPGELLPALDLERTDGKSAPALREWATIWLEHVVHEIGARPVFYSYPYFITGSMGGAKGLGGYPLWLASYGPNDGDRHLVQVVGPWHHIAVHQYTSKGRVDGINGDADLDVLVAVTLDELTYRKEPSVPETDWPKPLPSWWWQWARWRLGEGEYADAGPMKGPRPDVPGTIPKWAWRRLEALLDSRSDAPADEEEKPTPTPVKKKPQPVKKASAWVLRKRTRQKVADYCVWAAGHEPEIHYSQARPVEAVAKDYPKWRIPEYLDCSGLAIRAYQVAGAPDPSGYGYAGWGNTHSQIKHGRHANTPAVADLAFYGPRPGYPTHVAIVVKLDPDDPQDPFIVSHGSERCPCGPPLRAHYRGDFLEYRRYIG